MEKCDTRAKGLGHKGMTEGGGGGVKNCPNLRDLIYECPPYLMEIFFCIFLCTNDLQRHLGSQY